MLRILRTRLLNGSNPLKKRMRERKQKFDSFGTDGNYSNELLHFSTAVESLRVNSSRVFLVSLTFHPPTDTGSQTGVKLRAAFR